jgi:hypothetical protein
MSHPLKRLENSPAGETFWEGAWSLDGRRPEVRYYVCCAGDAAPSAAQLALRDRVGGSLERFLNLARVALLREIGRSPEGFGLSEEQGRALAASTADEAPFDGAEVTFYEDGKWFVRFTETSLPACSMLGVGVDFEGETPVRCQCLDSESSEVT